MSQPGNNIVSIRDLQFSWPRQARPVISIAHFDLKRTEAVFLRGPSGSGKTTLLSLIAAVLTPQAGSLQVNGINLQQLHGGKRDRFRADNIGLVFQQFNLLPFLSVIDNVQLPCRFSRFRCANALQAGLTLRQESMRLLAAMKLPVDDIINRSVMELSVGQQQRVAVARALIGQPPLIIADEPTSALDSDSQQAFLSLLFNEASKAGSTLLFVSHDAALATQFDRQLDLFDINQAALRQVEENASV